MPTNAPNFRADCFEASTLAQYREFGLLAEHLDDLAARSMESGQPFPRTLIEGTPGVGRRLVVRTLAQDLIMPIAELDASVRPGPDDVLDFLTKDEWRAAPHLVHLRHADLLTKEAQELVVKAFAHSRGAGATVQNRFQEAGWQVPDVRAGTVLIATTIGEPCLQGCLNAQFDLRLRLPMTEKTMRHRVRRVLHACGLAPSAGALIMLSAIWHADPESAPEHARALVRTCRDAGTAIVTLRSVETIVARLLPYLASSHDASTELARAIEGCRAKAEAAEVEAARAEAAAAAEATVETIPI